MNVEAILSVNAKRPSILGVNLKNAGPDSFDLLLIRWWLRRSLRHNAALLEHVKNSGMIQAIIKHRKNLLKTKKWRLILAVSVILLSLNIMVVASANAAPVGQILPMGKTIAEGKTGVAVSVDSIFPMPLVLAASWSESLDAPLGRPLENRQTIAPRPQSCHVYINQVSQRYKHAALPENEKWQGILQALERRRTDCYHNAAFLAYLGGAQMRLGLLSDAQDTLERALMLNPNHGQASVDYAQILFLTGQPFAAYDLNQQLIQKPELPESVQHYLKQRGRQWHSRFVKRDLSINTGIGYDSNLNNAADLDSLTLTGGLDITLDLSREAQPVPGASYNLSVAGRQTHYRIDGQHYWQFGLFSSSTGKPYDQQQLELIYRSSTLHQPLSAIASAEHEPQGWQSSWALGWQYVEYDYENAYQGTQGILALSHQPFEGCQSDYSLQLVHQNYPIDISQNGVESQLKPELSCRIKGGGLVSSYLATSYNHALEDRTGGHRIGFEWGVNWKSSLQRKGWAADMRLSYVQDTEGYSPLLNNDTPRDILRRQYRLQYGYPLSTALTLVGELQRIEQSSNIDLFSYTSNRGEIALRWALP